MRQIRCPVLVFHGDADRLVPTAMGRAVAAAAAGPVELVLIHGAGHNETYDRGGGGDRRKAGGVGQRPPPARSGPPAPRKGAPPPPPDPAPPGPRPPPNLG